MADTLADTFTVGWTAMADGTREDYEQLSSIFEGHARETLVPHLLSVMRLLEGPTLGYQIDRARHCRQSATRALRNGESSEFVAAALLHDIGDVLAPDNHSAVAAAILAPYVSEETEWVVRHHGLFQGYYYFHHLGGDRARQRALRRVTALRPLRRLLLLIRPELLRPQLRRPAHGGLRTAAG